MSPGLLHIEGLRFAWPDGRVLFDRLDVDLGPGLTWLTGEDGSGKSQGLEHGAVP